jgi:hypothetical protein
VPVPSPIPAPGIRELAEWPEHFEGRRLGTDPARKGPEIYGLEEVQSIQHGEAPGQTICRAFGRMACGPAPAAPEARFMEKGENGRGLPSSSLAREHQDSTRPAGPGGTLPGSIGSAPDEVPVFAARNRRLEFAQPLKDLRERIRLIRRQLVEWDWAGLEVPRAFRHGPLVCLKGSPASPSRTLGAGCGWGVDKGRSSATTGMRGPRERHPVGRRRTAEPATPADHRRR